MKAVNDKSKVNVRESAGAVHPCPLCGFARAQLFFSDQSVKFQMRWDYYHCETCDLVFRDPKSFLSPQEELAFYGNHQNTSSNLGYVRFLQPVVELVLKNCESSGQGLDFGSGPGPVLAELLTSAGYSMNVYDPYFSSQEERLIEKYDFVTCTEVMEHFHFPLSSFEKMVNLLPPKGHLFVMTQIRKGDLVEFKDWHYRRDPTHVSFYSEATLLWLAQKFDLELKIHAANLAHYSKHH